MRREGGIRGKRDEEGERKKVREEEWGNDQGRRRASEVREGLLPLPPQDG